MAHRTDKTRREDPNTDQQAHRNSSKTNDYKGEAQNVNDDAGSPLNKDEIQHARNKATESKGDESSEK